MNSSDKIITMGLLISVAIIGTVIIGTLITICIILCHERRDN